jgi:hypothetical protein
MPPLGDAVRLFRHRHGLLRDALPLIGIERVRESDRGIAQHAPGDVGAVRGLAVDGRAGGGHARAAPPAEFKDLADGDASFHEIAAVGHARAGGAVDLGIVAQQDRRADQTAARLVDHALVGSDCRGALARPAELDRV